MVRHSCQRGQASQRDFPFLRLAYGCGVVKMLHDTPRYTPVGQDCHVQDHPPIAVLERENPDSSQRFKFFPLCEIFHLLHRQVSLALGWFPWVWMGKLFTAAGCFIAAFCVLPRQHSSDHVPNVNECRFFFGALGAFIFLKSQLQRAWLAGS